jgi:hypothetical protein
MSTQSISPASASAHFTYPAAAAAAAGAAATTPTYFPVPFHLQNPQYAAWHAATAAAPTVAPVPVYNAVYPMPQVQQVRGDPAAFPLLASLPRSKMVGIIVYDFSFVY